MVFRRLTSILILAAILLTIIPFGTIQAETISEFAGGSGTAEDPYLIETKYHLDNVRNHLDAHFKMIADIEFTDADFLEDGDFYNDGKGWAPIGEYGIGVFNGVFNGNNHSVEGLYINTLVETTIAVGLFGLCKNAEIKNLCVSEGNILVSAKTIYAGGIVGFLESSIIENCTNLCNIKMSGNVIKASGGGIAGHATSSSSVSDCKNGGAITTIDIIGTSHSGGIIGYITYSSIVSNCCNSGYVESNYYAGGIVGKAIHSSIINNSYNEGDIVASTTEYYSYAGGISGVSVYDIQIIFCYNTGKISSRAQTSHCGGISGNINEGKISQCYNIGYLKASSTSYTIIGGITGYTCHRSTIEDSYNAGHIFVSSPSSIFSYAGGITGEIVNGCSIKTCYNVGMIEKQYLKVYAGGIAGRSETSTVGKCYFINNIEQGIAVGSGETMSETQNEMSNISGFQEFDFDIVWSFCCTDRYAYPILVALTVIHSYENDCDFDCNECGNIREVTHSYDNNCDIECNVCNSIRTIDHVYGNWIIEKRPTCVEEGSKHKVCTICGHIVIENEVATGVHNYDIKITEPTCTERGYTTYTCYCGDSYIGDYVEDLGHNYDFVITEPTCINQGYTTYTCYCGASYTDNFTDSLGHIFDNNCDNDCNHCGERRVASEHIYDTTCDTDCNECSAIRVIEHTFSEYIYNNDATEDADGTKTRICTICGYSETVTAEGTKLEKILIDTSTMFTDVSPSAWYKQYIDYSVTYGILSGAGNGKMLPNKTMTRAEFVQVLANLAGVDTSNKNITTEFTDVKAGHWFAPAVKWASENGIVSGMGEGKFAPNANITREQMCSMLVRYVESYLGITLENSVDKKVFADDNKISSWAKDAVYKCQQSGLVNGISETTFAPRDNATRAAVATIMSKFHEQYLR